MLESELRSLDLSLVCTSLQLPAELSALSEASCSQRMTFGDESATRIDDDLATVSEVASINGSAGVTLWTQFQGLIGAKLVRREAVVQFHDVEILEDIRRASMQPYLAVDLLAAFGCHICAYQIHGRLRIEGGCCVRGHFYGQYLNCLVLEFVREHELLGANYGAGGSVRGRTALQFGQRLMNFWTVHNLLQTVDVAKLTVRIVCTMPVILLRNLRKVLFSRSVLLHMLSAGVSKQLRSYGCRLHATNLCILDHEVFERIHAI